MKLKTIDEIFNEIELIPESELTKKYNKKEKQNPETEDFVYEMAGSNLDFGQTINTSITSKDFTKNYALVFFDLTHDPGYNNGINGCAYTSQLQLLDLKKSERLLVENYRYRDVGNSPFDHRNNFSEGKILEENKEKVVYGMKSHELLEFYELDTKTKEKNLIERVDLEYARKNKEKLEQFNKAFKELDKDAIKTFIEERHMFTTIKQINNDYAIAMLYDPYGDTGRRHAKTKLIVKDKGIIDLKYHEKQFHSNEVTQSFDIDDIKLKYDGENILLDYAIREEECGHSSSGSYWENTLGHTKHTLKINQKEFDLPMEKNMSIDYIVDREKNNILAYGNLNKIPIHMEGFRKDEPINYAYNIEKIEHDNKDYVVVSSIIDMLQYRNTWGGVSAVETQVRTTLYEVDKENQKLKEITSQTTDTNDRKKYEMKIDYQSDEMKLAKPRIVVENNEIKVNYKVTGKDFDEKEVKFTI